MTDVSSKWNITDESHRVNNSDYVETMTTVVTLNNIAGEVLTIITDLFDDYSMTSVELERGEELATLYLGMDEDLLDDTKKLMGLLRENLRDQKGNREGDSNAD